MTIVRMAVPGSRRPVILDAAGGVLVPTRKHQHPVQQQQPAHVLLKPYQAAPHGPPTAPSRRKPQRTFKSPSLNDDYGLRIEGERPTNPKPKAAVPQQQQEQPLAPAPLQAPRESGYKYIPPTRPAPSLYHPLGPLAASLPPLNLNASVVDPEEPVPAVQTPQETAPPVRARKPAGAKARENDGASPAPTGTPSNGVENSKPENKSPRKRRAGGAAGSGTASGASVPAAQKRKRREPEDEAYPAKRPRGAAAVRGDATPPVVSNVPLPEDDVEEEAAPRRTTRSRTAATRPAAGARGGRKRADSSASEGSVASDASALGTRKKADVEAESTPATTAEATLDEHDADKDVLMPPADEREDGEDDGGPPMPAPAPEQRMETDAPIIVAKNALVVSPTEMPLPVTTSAGAFNSAIDDQKEEGELSE
ncbi:hypothetical protein PENSPDRAFT_661156 [Peniophora sp. CONT]|nr:hypothetical protein PENSPDRAFT_661156 [Peniophora sp. CONT]